MSGTSGTCNGNALNAFKKTANTMVRDGYEKMSVLKELADTVATKCAEACLDLPGCQAFVQTAGVGACQLLKDASPAALVSDRSVRSDLYMRAFKENLCDLSNGNCGDPTQTKCSQLESDKVRCALRASPGLPPARPPLRTLPHRGTSAPTAGLIALPRARRGKSCGFWSLAVFCALYPRSSSSSSVACPAYACVLSLYVVCFIKRHEPVCFNFQVVCIAIDECALDNGGCSDIQVQDTCGTLAKRSIAYLVRLHGIMSICRVIHTRVCAWRLCLTT